MKSLLSRVVVLCLAGLSPALIAAADRVGNYRVFETAVTNDRPYANRFTDVELLAEYVAPSGRRVEFRGFFDGDGRGGGAANAGNVWKLRFMPDETGTWNYTYRWTDGTKGGTGSFESATAGAGLGILRAYTKNPHWFAYNGTQPVWLKSYYESGHGAIGQDFDWVLDHVYRPMIARGYNHLQVNWLLSLCCFDQYYHDGPPQETTNLALYRDGQVATTMNLDVWKRMERHMGWLNEQNVGVHMFLGVDGSRNSGPGWARLSAEDKDFYVRYMVARLAPYANLAGWNFVWEVEGSRETHELGFMRLVARYDVFNHLRTYQDEMPRENHYDLPEYTFAAVENHRIAAPTRELDRPLEREAWTHHMACLVGYAGKPVFMSEGNSLWRRYWFSRVNATQDDLRRSAWACAIAGASFTWAGHQGEGSLVASGPEGLPFTADHPFAPSAKVIDVLGDVMTREVNFSAMDPHDELLAEHQVLRVYALAEPGRQYLVFAPDGEPFALKLAPGNYSRNTWIDTRTGRKVPAAPMVGQANNRAIPFTAPDRATDWALVVRAD